MNKLNAIVCNIYFPWLGAGAWRAINIEVSKLIIQIVIRTQQFVICSRSKFCDCHKLLELEILTQKDYKITFFISRCTHSFLPVVLPVWQTWIFFISIFRFYKMIHTRSDCISFDFTYKPSWSSYQYFWLCSLHLRSLPKFWMWIQMMSQKSPARQVNHKNQ